MKFQDKYIKLLNNVSIFIDNSDCDDDDDDVYDDVFDDFFPTLND